MVQDDLVDQVGPPWPILSQQAILPLSIPYINTWHLEEPNPSAVQRNPEIPIFGRRNIRIESAVRLYNAPANQRTILDAVAKIYLTGEQERAGFPDSITQPKELNVSIGYTAVRSCFQRANGGSKELVSDHVIRIEEQDEPSGRVSKAGVTRQAHIAILGSDNAKVSIFQGQAIQRS